MYGIFTYIWLILLGNVGKYIYIPIYIPYIYPMGLRMQKKRHGSQLQRDVV